MVKISASNIRCSVVTESGKVATWFDESISHVCSKLEHPATLYPEFANDKIISLHTCVLYTGTVSQVLTESIPFWAVDSTETHFGQWILQRPILGNGFYKDPFWAVDSTKTHSGQLILSTKTQFEQWTQHHSVEIS